MDKPVRKPNRWRNYDYSLGGAYFITVCAKDRACLFRNAAHTDDAVGARIARPRPPLPSLSACGKAADASIQNIPRVYPMVVVEKYVIMPNHIHLLMMIMSNECGRAMRAPTVSTIINQMKGSVTKQVGASCWQKSFHDHVIRDENEFLMTWNYIDLNPMTWARDCFYRA